MLAINCFGVSKNSKLKLNLIADICLRPMKNRRYHKKDDNLWCKKLTANKPTRPIFTVVVVEKS
jgi:hypothetical protein